MSKLRSLAAILAAVALVALCGCGLAEAAAPFHIGIMTGTVSQQEDELRGAEKLMEIYGDEAHGGMIKHVTYPDNFMQEMETTISQLVGLSDDPMMKAIIASTAVPGTTEAYRRIKEKRPDIICLAGNSQEDPGVIGSIADLTVNANDIYRGYLIPVAAKKMGAKNFVHISFPRHMSYELPVSYTHLDVYKRQGNYCVKPSVGNRSEIRLYCRRKPFLLYLARHRCV